MDFVGSLAGHAHFPEGDFHIAGSLKKRLKLLTTCHVCLEFLRTILINGEEQESVAHSVGSGCLVFFQQPLRGWPNGWPSSEGCANMERQRIGGQDEAPKSDRFEVYKTWWFEVYKIQKSGYISAKCKNVDSLSQCSQGWFFLGTIILDRLHLILLHHDGQLPHLWMQVGQHSQGVAD